MQGVANPKVICSRFAPIPSRKTLKWEQASCTSRERVTDRRGMLFPEDQRVTDTGLPQLITQRLLVQIRRLLRQAIQKFAIIE